jgi:hypothetical protein
VIVVMMSVTCYQIGAMSGAAYVRGVGGVRGGSGGFDIIVIVV